MRPLELPTVFVWEGAMTHAHTGPGWPVAGAPVILHLGCTALPSETFVGYGLGRVPESSGAIDSTHYRRESANKGAGRSCILKLLLGDFNCRDVQEKNMTLWGHFPEWNSLYIKRQQMTHNWMAALGLWTHVSHVDFFSALQTLTLNCDK